jgi:serine protease
MATTRATYDRPTCPARPAASGWRFRPDNPFSLVLAGLLAAIAGLALSGVFSHIHFSSATARRPGTVSAAAAAADYAPRTLVVGYSGSSEALRSEIRLGTGVSVTSSPLTGGTPDERLLELPAAANVPGLAAKVAKLSGVNYAVPDYIGHAASRFYPDDPGRGTRAKGWEKVQWNLLTPNGINAPEAWANLLADHRAGARGVKIAVVDTGVAFRNWRIYRKSPDFRGTKFIDPCDLVAGGLHGRTCDDPYALDRDSHGTFVAGEIAESTNDGYSLTGLAYQASIMPVRVLDADGNGDASTIAAGIRYAVEHGAQVINLSLVFTAGTTSAEIPDIESAITYAHNHRVVVVGAAGNDEVNSLEYPAALPDVISVGATTRDKCLASYSDIGKGLDIVAPGGGDDANSIPGTICHPNRNLPDIYQMTFNDPTRPSVFSLPSGWFGTSMAAPDVSAAAAMVIASGVIGAHPTPAAILSRLEATARPVGIGRDNNYYGYGLLNVGAATAKGGPKKVVITTTTTTTTKTMTTTTMTGTVTATTPTTTTPTTTTETTTTATMT